MSGKRPCDNCERLIDVDEANTDGPSEPDGLPNYFLCDRCNLFDSTRELLFEVANIPDGLDQVPSGRVKRLVNSGEELIDENQELREFLRECRDLYEKIKPKLPPHEMMLLEDMKEKLNNQLEGEDDE